MTFTPESLAWFATSRNSLLPERASTCWPRSRVPDGRLQGARASWVEERQGVHSSIVTADFPGYHCGRTSTGGTYFSRDRGRLHAKGFRAAVAPEIRQVSALPRGPEGTRQVLKHMLHVETRSLLPNELLVKAGKMAMATSTELRGPVLRARVLEFAGSLPKEYKVRGRATKRVLRSALRALVPAEVLARKRTGLPSSRWLAGDLRGVVRETLLDGRAACESLNRTALESPVGNSDECATWAKDVFSVLVLELWHQKFEGVAVV